MEHSFVNRPAYKRLKELASDQLSGYSIADAFQENPLRRQEFSVIWEEFYIDYSKNLVDKEVMDTLFRLAKESKLLQGVEDMFTGKNINVTENRPALHTALRAPSSHSVNLNGKDIVPEIQEVLNKMYSFAQDVHSGKLKGATGKTITDVVNIGIGGSDLGPAMICEALKQEQNQLATHFVSNVDGFHLEQTLKGLDPDRTLVLVVSKTFTTQETMTNALAAKEWLLESIDSNHLELHLAAVSTNVSAASEFGVVPERVFGFWDWVGGRYSLWGAVGLSIILGYGKKVFSELLSGAFAMDSHFRTAPLENNIPVIMALLGIWYNNFLNAESHAVLPYVQALSKFPAYLQQADMESNGKSINKLGQAVDYQTGPILWGEPGTNGQHAFYQLLHQGTKLVPVDLIVAKKAHSKYKDQHNKLISNCIAQGEALMKGKTIETARHELEQKGMKKSEIKKLLPFKIFAGNKPSTTFVMDELNPKTLGSLVAIYEHKVFVQGWIWDVNSFDQWGVELGKELASTVLSELKGQEHKVHDGSTTYLIEMLKSGGQKT